MKRNFAKLENEGKAIIEKHPGQALLASEVGELLNQVEGDYFPNKLDLYDYMNKWLTIGMAIGYRAAQAEAKERK